MDAGTDRDLERIEALAEIARLSGGRAKGARTPPEVWEQLLPLAKTAYERGSTTRDVQEVLGRSYGQARHLLVKAGVQFRERGSVAGAK